MKYSEKEQELIEAIRNYRKAYSNGARELDIYIMDLVYEPMANEYPTPSPFGGGHKIL